MSDIDILPRRAPTRVLACGAYLKNRACLIEDHRVLWSRPHGDLGTAANREALDASIGALLAAASGPLQGVAHDMHPDFHSTRVACNIAGRLGIPAIAVQHHHAHIAVVQAEQSRDEAVIGVALDGAGLGDDGASWGGELLWVDAACTAHQWHRLDHLAELALPGGDLAAREPWRMAAAVLHRIGRQTEIQTRFGPQVGKHTAAMVAGQLQRRLHCPVSTSAGRWFDAAAGALGVSLRQSGEAEAAMALEGLAQGFVTQYPAFDFVWRTLDPTPLVAGLFALADHGVQARRLGAAMFHRALANGIAHRAIEAAHERATTTVAFGGGCFMNAVLTGHLSRTLQAAGLTVVQSSRAGCGDAGLALGQAWVASCAIGAALGGQFLGEAA